MMCSICKVLVLYAKYMLTTVTSLTSLLSDISPSIGIHMVAELGSIPLEDLRDRKGGKN